MAQTKKKHTKKELESLAIKIIDFCCKHHMFTDVNIYVGDYVYSPEPKNNNSKKFITNRKSTYYVTYGVPDVDYSNPETITMTFEGTMYDVMNYGDGKLAEELKSIFAEYGLYYELGHAWSLSAWDLP